MKPSFALTLSHESIGLLHRTAQGWVPVGTVATDDPDLTGALEYLRRTALGLEPQGFATKLVIPNSEILYDTIFAPGPKAAIRRAQIAAALEGRTPYAVDELVFDWSGTGDMVQVAVVAREFLAEAESFAKTNGFNPVSFVALPDPGGFGAEPWFGTTSCAADILAPGEKVVRDQDPIRILSRTAPRSRARDAADDAAPAAESATAAAADLSPDPAANAPEPLSSASAPSEAPEPEPTETEAPALATPPETAVAFGSDQPPAEPPEAERPVAEPAAPDVPLPDPVAPADPVAGQPAPEPAVVPEPEPPQPVPSVEAALPDPAPPEADAAAAMAEPVAPPAPPRKPVAAIATPDPAPAAAPLAENRPADAPLGTRAGWPLALGDTPPAPAPQGPAAGMPEMGSDQTLSWPGDDGDDALGRAQAALAASLAPPPGPAEAALAAGLRRDTDLSDLPPPIAPHVQRAMAAARAGRDAGSAGRTPPKSGATAAAGLSEKMQKIIGKTAKVSKAKVKEREKPPARPGTPPASAPLPASASQPQVPPTKSEAEKMTVFGQRRQPVRGKPRFLGLALTGGLLLILLLIAVWAATVLEPPRQDGAVQPAEPAGQAALSPPAETAPAAETAAAPPAEAPAEQPQAEASAETAATDPAPNTTPGTAPAESPEAQAAEPPPQAVPGDQPATAGLSTLAEDVGAEVTLPRADTALEPPTVPSVAVLPQADPAPGAGVVLPEFGALYQFAADGSILPTPEGVITPDGVRLVAGRPERLPPPRPAGLAPEPQAAALPAEPPLAEPAADSAAAAPVQPAPAAPGAIAILPTPEPAAPAAAASAFAPDSTLPRQRPPQRPAGLAGAAPEQPQAAPEADEDGALPASNLADFAARRPAKRPASIAAAAAASATAAEADRAREVAAAAAAAAAAASTAAAAPADQAGVLAPTRRPPSRPADFSRAVAAAVAAAVAPPPPSTRTAPAARAPEPEPEPAPAQRASRTESVNRASLGARADEVPEDGEPEVSGRAPDAPIRASVARQATVTGALNLGRTNLIGVFGTQNARYALVRESGGRLVRVKVGDRVDGGRVTAIGQTELSYQRGGQTVQLRMPRG